MNFMQLFGAQYGTVTKIWYRLVSHPHDPERQFPAVSVAVDLDGEEHVVDIPNGDFFQDNIALQFMAYCKAKPSDVEAAYGKKVPLIPDENGQLVFPDIIFQQGGIALNNRVWCPTR